MVIFRFFSQKRKGPESIGGGSGWIRRPPLLMVIIIFFSKKREAGGGTEPIQTPPWVVTSPGWTRQIPVEILVKHQKLTQTTTLLPFGSVLVVNSVKSSVFVIFFTATFPK